MYKNKTFNKITIQIISLMINNNVVSGNDEINKSIHNSYLLKCRPNNIT